MWERLSANFYVAFDAVISNKLRSVLTALGIIFGVGAVIAMLAIGNGAQQEILEQIKLVGVNNIVIEPIVEQEEKNLSESADDTEKEKKKFSPGLTIRDAQAIIDIIPTIQENSPEIIIDTYIIKRGIRRSTKLVGVTPTYFKLTTFNLAEGKMFTPEQILLGSPVCIIGKAVRTKFFPTEDPIGKTIKCGSQWLEVIGVLEDRDLGKDEFQGVSLGGDRNRVFIPLETAFKRLKFELLESELDAIRLRLSEGADPQLSALTVNHLLSRRHGEENDYELIIPAALLKQQQQTQQIFTIVMSAIAGISLLVGGIGIMNIMLATVLERTREIGLLRALGARKRDIQVQFLLESATVAGIGAFIGIFFGLLLAFVIQQFAGWPAGWSLMAIVLSVSICLVTGVGFGWYPARQAAALDPIRALHAE